MYFINSWLRHLHGYQYATVDRWFQNLMSEPSAILCRNSLYGMLLFFLTLDRYDPEGVLKITENAKMSTNNQSVQSKLLLLLLLLLMIFV